MPFIETKTTVRISPYQEEELTKEFGKAIEIFSGKSEEWLMLNFVGESRMAFRGTSSPDIAMLDVQVFGKVRDSEYARMTERLCEIINSVLGIPRNRVYVKYSEVENWGYNGYNF